MPAESSYIPGICNINKAEVAYRKKAMWFGVAMSAGLLVILLLLDVSWWLSVPLLLIPVYIGAIGYLQVRYKFCVSYGSTGQQNADENSESAHIVTDKNAQAADKAKTRRMNLQALSMTIIALVVACGVLYVF